MTTTPLSIDVYVAPRRPYNCPDQLGQDEVATWAPSSSTMISGPTEAIVIDALLTFQNAERFLLVLWVGVVGQTAVRPPSTAMVAPVM
jgi:hypothetical protein